MALAVRGSGDVACDPGFIICLVALGGKRMVWAVRGRDDVACDSSFVGIPWWEEDGLGSESQRSGDVACGSYPNLHESLGEGSLLWLKDY
ncbi:uncharacterized protein LOC106144752 [Ictidomys tridecemlineatus]